MIIDSSKALPRFACAYLKSTPPSRTAPRYLLSQVPQLEILISPLAGSEALEILMILLCHLNSLIDLAAYLWINYSPLFLALLAMRANILRTINLLIFPRK